MIGIDVGQTQSKVAYIDQAGKPNVIMNPRGEPSTPSILYFQDDGTVLVGKDAEEQAYVEPEKCVRNFKLDLGSTQTLLGNGRSLTPTDAAAALIGKLKEYTEQQLGIEVREVVATCPANFHDDSKQALLEAFDRNSIEVLKLVPEPTAAGIAYALGEQGRRDVTYAVFDFGGGTFDASVQKIKGDQIITLATEGIRQCGGNDLNECLKKRILDEVEAKMGQRPSPQNDALFFHDLEQRVEAAKISLGNQKEVPIVAAYGGSQVVVKISQEQFHKDIEPIVQQSLDALGRAVTAAGMKMTDLDYLIMVGGTSRLPYIQKAAADYTGLCPKTDIDQEKAISYGAALASINELKKKGKTATIRGHVIPAPDMFVQDIMAHAVGCCVVDASGSNKRLVNSVIIPKNTPVPCQKCDCFYLEHEDQTEARIEILQGEADAGRDVCLLIGELVLDNLPREPIRSQRIQVEYLVDGNGMVTATATDFVSSKNQTVSVDYKKGIAPKQKPLSV